MDLFEAQKDSILSLVNEIFTKGEFNCPITDPVCAETEKVIGVMTDYEKAILLARNTQNDKFNAMLDELSKSEDEPDMHELSILRRISETFDNLLWSSIAFHSEDKSSNVGIRQDWQIVAISRKKDGLPEKCQNCEKLENCLIADMMRD